MNRKKARSRGRRKLASLRLDIDKARARLSALRLAIREARSDAGLTAARDVQAENRHLHATNLLAVQAARASQAALDVAVEASQTDPLTGLRNRSVLRDRLTQALELARRLGQHVGVYMLDLDGFKELNDRHGHALGDLVLRRVANVLTATVRSSDTVCRLGGDEFLVIASTSRRDDVDHLARKISQALREPGWLAGQAVTVSASVGFSVFPEDGDAADVLVGKADEAMYRIKRCRSADAGR